MGFFSWMTSDTNRSISNKYSNRGAFPVYVLCPDGSKIKESDYEGYGAFGGKDIYALLAKWNHEDMGLSIEKVDSMPDIELRKLGIDLQFGGKEIKYPIKIVEDPELNYEDVDVSEDCPYQGYFHPDNEDEYDDEW